MIGSSRKEGKKKSDRIFPCRDCFAKAVAENVTPFGLCCLAEILKLERSVDLEGQVSGRSITVFMVSCLSGSDSLGLREPR